MGIRINNSYFRLNNGSFRSTEIFTPGIITSGSVLYVDASAPASYPGTGTSWYDLSGYGNTATLVNSPTYTGSDSFYFNGTNNYAGVETSASLNLASSSFTVSQVIKATSFTGTEIGSLLWEEIRGDNLLEPISIRYNWFTTPTASVTLVIFNDAGVSIELTSNTILSTGSIYNIVGTYDKAVAKIYINGTLSNSVSSTLVVGSSNADARWIIGAAEINRPRYFNGNIYNTIIYNRALSADEVSSNYAIQQAKYGI